MRVQVRIRVSGVGGGTAGWCGVTAGQVEAVLPMEQHLLLVALHSERKAEVEQSHGVNRFTVFSALNALKFSQKTNYNPGRVLKMNVFECLRMTLAAALRLH